jgi:hypothetical protein
VKLAPHHRRMHATWNAHDRSVTWAFAEAGKTSQLIARFAFELARNPALRVNLVSGTLTQAEKTVRAVGRLLESPQVQRLFPGVTIETRDGAITLTNRVTNAKDASLVPSGLGAGSVLGGRFDLVVGDDLLDLESTRTQQGREAAWVALVSVHLSRLAPGGRVWLAGTAWHVDDVLERAARLHGWHSERFPVVEGNGNPTWPERWPAERVEARRLELGPLTFGRVMMCQPLDEASLIFRPDDLDRALENGRNPAYSPVGGRVIVAVDPAWTVGATSDESGIVMVVIDVDGFRHVTHVEGLRVDHDRLTARVVALASANRATVYVESNGAGGVIASNIGRRVPCRPLATTATSKRARVEALSAELASGRWVFRCPMGAGAELRKLVNELQAFTFDTHAGDRASALLLSCEGARAIESRPKGGIYDKRLLIRDL